MAWMMYVPVTHTKCHIMCVEQQYHFDEVFSDHTSQADLFLKSGVPSMVQKVLDGYNATVFAYGQTGSGKTFTMEGYNYESVKAGPSHAEVTQVARPKVNLDAEPDKLGLVPRTIRFFFETIAKMSASGKEISVQCSFLQIYNEQIYDLLNPGHLRLARNQTNHANSQGLRLRWTSTNEEGFYVEGLMVKECTTPDDVLGQFHKGIQNKIMASHTMNAASSRSHCLFTLHLTLVDANNPTGVAIRSKFCLVDLAGSERASQTKATGNVLRESIGINKSLFVLRKVIDTVVMAAGPGGGGGGDSKEHIPYRDSKLTSLLQQSLGGNSMTLMIACLSPSDTYVEENMSTLTYASKASSISNDPVKNEDPQTKLIRKLKMELNLLKQQLSQAHNIREVISVEVCPNCRKSVSDSSTNSNLTEATKYNVQRASPQKSLASPADAGEPIQIKHDKKSTNQTEEVHPSTKENTDGRTSEPPRVGERKLARGRPSAQATSDHLIKMKDFERDLCAMKQDTLGHVELIKRMFQVEQQIRKQLDEDGEGRARAEQQNRALNMENRELRERIEVLEYLTVGELADATGSRREGQPLVQKASKFSQKVLDEAVTTACARIAGDIHPNKASELQLEIDDLRQKNQSLNDQVQKWKEKCDQMKQSQRAAVPLMPQNPREAGQAENALTSGMPKLGAGRRRDLKQAPNDDPNQNVLVKKKSPRNRNGKRSGGKNANSKQGTGTTEEVNSGVLTVDELKRLLAGSAKPPVEKKQCKY
jgi:hypothetical protein